MGHCTSPSGDGFAWFRKFRPFSHVNHLLLAMFVFLHSQNSQRRLLGTVWAIHDICAVTDVCVLGERDYDYQFSCWICVITVPSRTIRIWKLCFCFPSYFLLFSFWNSAVREGCRVGRCRVNASHPVPSSRRDDDATATQPASQNVDAEEREEMKNKGEKEVI